MAKRPVDQNDKLIEILLQRNTRPAGMHHPLTVEEFALKGLLDNQLEEGASDMEVANTLDALHEQQERDAATFKTDPKAIWASHAEWFSAMSAWADEFREWKRENNIT